jgi:hypothetical protein
MMPVKCILNQKWAKIRANNSVIPAFSYALLVSIATGSDSGGDERVDSLRSFDFRLDQELAILEVLEEPDG